MPCLAANSCDFNVYFGFCKFTLADLFIDNSIVPFIGFAMVSRGKPNSFRNTFGKSRAFDGWPGMNSFSIVMFTPIAYRY
jgi:hypothetical protein